MPEPSPQKPPKPPVTWEQAVEQFKRHNPAHPPGTPTCKPTEAQMQARARLWEKFADFEGRRGLKLESAVQ